MGKGKDKAKKADKAAKKLRKAGKKALKVAEHPALSEIVAAAMMAAAAALSEGKGGKRPAQKGEGRAGAGTEAGKAADVLKALAIDVARRTLESWEDSAAGGKDKRTRGEGAEQPD